MRSFKTKELVGTAVLTAVVIVLQLCGSFIRFGGFSVSLVLLPIVVGSAMYGAFSGAWLGLVFGFTVLLSGDAALFLAIDPLATFGMVLVKGTAAGLVAGLVYRAASRLNRTAATFAAAFICPVVNTGIFLIGCRLFFLDAIAAMAQSFGFEGPVHLYLLTVFVGANFIFELLFNMVLAPVVIRIVDIGKGMEKQS